MKSVVRRDILHKIAQMSAGEKQYQSVQIQKQLAEALSRESGVWGAFHHLGDEPHIQWNEVSDKIEWAFPCIVSDGALEFRRGVQQYRQSELGFSEPLDGERMELKDIRGFIIPGVAYDENGHRMGRGQGYYDRTLAGYSGRKIGICFNVSLCDQLPREEHDIQCDLVVTAGAVHTADKSEGVKKWN